MQENGASITFEPRPPSPLETWQLLIALLVFIAVIAAIIWKLRSRRTKPAGSLDLHNH